MDTFMGYFGFAVIATFIVIVLVGFLRALYSPKLTGKEDRAKEILRERYARGEISRAEYQERLHDLG